MYKKKVFWWTDKSDSEWLSVKLNKWVTQCQGYTRLHSSRLSRGCQTMMNRPEQPKMVWSRSSNKVLVDLPQPLNHDDNTISNQEINEEALLDVESDDEQCPAVHNDFVQNFFNNKEIVDYISYLNKPIINMNDNYIEIHQYHFNPALLTTSNAQEIIRPPSRRKHRINMNSTDIVNTAALESTYSDKYSDFLVKKSDEVNRNIEIVQERKEISKSPQQKLEGLDEHRELRQSLVTKHEVCKDDIRIRRGHTFNAGSCNNNANFGTQNDLRNFLSFRASKKNKSGRRKKKIVVGEKGLDGPIWPGVLLTFDRAVSPVQSKCIDESDV
uniref:Uncharacterized protein n=1 Tax=Clastoptera arizonana TaxID=38151 RepID=A0A1B6E779_9HEMI